MKPGDPNSKRLEALGDAAWKLAVASKIHRENLPQLLEQSWNSNTFMMRCCRHLGIEMGTVRKKEICGAYFEIHIAELYLQQGFDSVARLCNELCAVGK